MWRRGQWRISTHWPNSCFVLTLYICVIACHSWQQVVFLQPEAFVNRRRLCSEFLVSCCLRSVGGCLTKNIFLFVRIRVGFSGSRSVETLWSWASLSCRAHQGSSGVLMSVFKHWQWLTQTGLETEWYCGSDQPYFLRCFLMFILSHFLCINIT